MKANEDNGVLGLFGTDQEPRTSYGIGDKEAKKIRNGEIVKLGNISFAAIDIVLNQFSTDVILEKLENLKHRSGIRVMTHEQYFYEDYKRYQPDYEQKLRATFAFLLDRGYQREFYENLI